VLYLTQFLQAQGHDSVVLCPPDSQLWQYAQAAGVPTWPLPMRYELDLLAAWRLGGYLRQHQVDILHMHAPHAHSIGLLAGLLAPAVRKVVSRRVDFAPIRNVFSRCKYTAPGVRFLTVSEAVRSVLLDSGIPAQQVQTVYSGIDLRRIDAVPAAPPLFPASTRVIGTVGHLAGHKGHTYLLQAIPILHRLVPDLRLVIIGDGALRPQLEAQAAALGITAQVQFMGFRHDVLALLQTFEVFVFPSYLEGLGTSLLDAMALRKPIVATRAGGIPEVVQDGVTGLLVPPRNPQALAQALGVLLQHPAQARAFGNAGRARVEQYFTAEHMGRCTLEAYERMLVDPTP
jgi:glycosyltransferase involved in cell wall biosynthesis